MSKIKQYSLVTLQIEVKTKQIYSVQGLSVPFACHAK